MSRSQPRGSFSSILEKEKKERERVVTGKNKRSATLENYMRKKNKTVLPISMSLNILVSIEGIKRLVYNLSGNRPKPDPAQENLNLEGLSRFPEKNSSCIFFFFKHRLWNQIDIDSNQGIAIYQLYGLMQIIQHLYLQFSNLSQKYNAL